MNTAVTRLITITITEEDRLLGFFEVFILGSNGFVYSLHGKDINHLLKPENFAHIIKKHKLTKVHFVMEPKIVSIIKKTVPNIIEGDKDIIDNKEVQWLTVSLN